jgi:hypothetical protein
VACLKRTEKCIIVHASWHSPFCSRNTHRHSDIYAVITLLNNMFIVYSAIKFWHFETVSIWDVSSCRFLPVLPKNCFLHRRGRRWRRQYTRFNYWYWSTNTQVLICQKLMLKLIFMLRGNHFWYSELCVWLIAWFLVLFILGQREVLCDRLWTNLK